MADNAWHGCVIRGTVALALIVVLAVGGTAVGSTWRQAVAIGAATVGTWYLSLATHQLRQATVAMFRAMHRRDEGGCGRWVHAVHLAGPAAGLGACLLAATMAVVMGGPPMVVFGVVSVVVADVVFVVCRLLQQSAEQLGATIGSSADALRSLSDAVVDAGVGKSSLHVVVHDPPQACGPDPA